jgi:hypothetical protein
MTLLQQPSSQRELRAFDPHILLKTLSDISDWLFARVPYPIIGAIVLIIFMVAGRYCERLLLTAGKRSQLRHPSCLSNRWGWSKVS